MGQSWTAGVSTLATASRDLVLPPVCRLCGQAVDESAEFCGECENQLRISEPMLRRGCRRCGMPAAGVQKDGVQAAEETPQPCAQCRHQRLNFDGVAALWAYQGRVCDAVVAAKYTSRAALGDALGRRLGSWVAECFGDDLPQLITFVPSHATRQLSRGGNANQVIARAVARRVGCRCRVLLRTTRRIAKQAWLDDSARVVNVRDAFALKKGYAWASRAAVAGRHVMVVDDVLTTGATANEVARVVYGGGARRVSLAIVARALRS